MKEAITFRLLNPKFDRDRYDVMSLDKEVFGKGTFTPPMWKYRFKKHRYLLALDGEDIIGYIGGCHKRDTLYIDNLAVYPGYRGQGIASHLVREFCRGDISSSVFLHVNTTHRSVIIFYHRQGFTITREIKGFYDYCGEGDAYIMSKPLNIHKMDIVLIETIPHKVQRYNTIGDWYFLNSGEINGPKYSPPKKFLSIRVSQLKDWRYSMLVAIHELIESFFCTAQGVTPDMVDSFDFQWENDPVMREKGEPGDDPRNPAYKQHQIATKVEKALCRALGIKWSVYDGDIERMWRTRT